jgi:hypothetical protein
VDEEDGDQDDGDEDCRGRDEPEAEQGEGIDPIQSAPAIISPAAKAANAAMRVALASGKEGFHFDSLTRWIRS